MKKNKFTCPYCYEYHKISECNVKCSYSVGGPSNSDGDPSNSDGDPHKLCRFGYSKDKDRYVLPKFITKCLDCTEASKYVYCPNVEETDVSDIPRGCREGSAFSIALAGSKSSGKSNYIAVLIQEIRSKLTNSFGARLDYTCHEYTHQEYIRKYYEPLYIKQDSDLATDANAVSPLIFPLNLPKGNAIFTFYDTAGENFKKNTIMATINRYFANANSIILLVDPLQVPSIRTKLEGENINLPALATEAEVVLNRVVNVIRERRGRRDQNRLIDIPLAIAVTKIDVLEKLGILDECAPSLKRESMHLERGCFVWSDFHAVDSQVRVLFEQMTEAGQQHGVIAQARNFRNVAFFGLSSLGGIPEGDRISDIKPRRVLDPLLWVLAKKGLVKTVKH